MFDIVYDKKLEQQSEELGFTKLFVLGENLCFVEEKQFSKLGKLKCSSFISKGTRQAFENKKIEFIIPVMDSPKDHTHYRNSGMDQVLAKLAKANSKTIIFDFSELLKAKNRQKVLGRWLQNIRLCKKYKVSWEICSFAKDLLGMRSANDFRAVKRVLTCLVA